MRLALKQTSSAIISYQEHKLSMYALDSETKTNQPKHRWLASKQPATSCMYGPCQIHICPRGQKGFRVQDVEILGTMILQSNSKSCGKLTTCVMLQGRYHARIPSHAR